MPRLRFPEFQGKWETKEIGQIMKIGSGKDYKHLGEGDIPVFGTGGYMTSVNDYLMNGETICIGRKGTINKPFYHCGKFWTVDTLFYTHSFKNTIPRFALYIFEKINWLQYNEASGVPSLSKSTIEQIEISIPFLPEQKKIASLLSLIDERIECQRKIIEGLQSYKSAVSKKIFSQELRFKNQDEKDFPDWEMYKLGQLLIEANEKTTRTNQYRILSSTAKGLFNQDEYFTRDIASKDNTGYKILKKGQLVFSPQNLWLGNINVNMNFEIGIVSPSYKIFSFNETYTIPTFCQYILLTPKMMYEYEQSSVQGASVVRRNLDMEKFYQIEVLMPALEEQIKIANFLSCIDQKVNLEIALLEQLKSQKQYLLQQLFI